MTVAIIGSGNVATILGRLLTQKNHKVVHVASRNVEHAKLLADELSAGYSDYNGITNVNADIYLIAIADAAIQECMSHFQFNDKLVLHTAGSVSKDVLKGISSNYGVLYPLQSLRKEMKHVPAIPFLVDGKNGEVIKKIEAFALTLSDNVRSANDEERLKLHAAAVIVSNFSNHLYALAEDFCKKENVSFALLKPLIIETAQRVDTLSPSDTQTGPAIRKDIHTLDKHLRLLANYPRLRYIYLKLTDSIMNP